MELNTLLPRTKIILIFASALLVSIAFHPLGLHFFAWFGLVPLLFAIHDIKPGQAFKSGLFFGFFFSLLSLFWLVFLQIPTKIKILMLFGLILMFLYIGLYFGVGFLIANKIGIWFLPFAIAGLEYIKGLGELGFPWLSLGYSQARYPIFIQQASIYGVYGVSFWLVLLNIALFRAIRIRKIKNLIIAILIFTVPLLYGVLRMKPLKEKLTTIGIIQPNIDPNLKFTSGMREETFDRLIRLSENCAAEVRQETCDSLALVIWPETAIPVFLKTPGQYQNLILDLANRINTPILTGSPIYDHTSREIYNGAILVEPKKPIEQEYRKIHLVPFGEHIPFDRDIPLFRKIDVGGGEYSAGNECTVFETRGLKFSCLICFESIFPELSRKFVRRDAALLLNITNDGWFGKISGPQQHNDMAILRTVENGVPLARCSNTGISMVVDQYGRVLQETKLFEQAYIVERIAIVKIKTINQSIGDILPILSLILITLFLVIKYFASNYKAKIRVNSKNHNY